LSVKSAQMDRTHLSFIWK